jgi:hypothetical protein
VRVSDVESVAYLVSQVCPSTELKKELGDRQVALRRRLEEVSALLEGGAKVNAPGELGNTALHVRQIHVAKRRHLLIHVPLKHLCGCERPTISRAQCTSP